MLFLVVHVYNELASVVFVLIAEFDFLGGILADVEEFPEVDFGEVGGKAFVVFVYFDCNFDGFFPGALEHEGVDDDELLPRLLQGGGLLHLLAQAHLH